MPAQHTSANSTGRWRICVVVLALVAANLVPLAGVLYWGWMLGSVMLFFWLDNVAIGLFAIARIHLTPLDRTVRGGRLSAKKHEEFTATFGFVYFFFTAIHGLFLGLIFSAGVDYSALGYGFLALCASRGFDFVFNYVLPKKYLTADAQDEGFSAFIGVIVLHVAFLGVAFLIAAMKTNAVAPLVALVMLNGHA